MDVFLHFDGLPEGAHTYFYNCRGAPVSIYRGDFVIVDSDANPFWKTAWIEKNHARQVDRIPEGVDFLYEYSEPRPPNIPPPWGDEDPPQGTFSLYAVRPDTVAIKKSDGTTCNVLDLTPEAIEQIRQHYMPCELPGIVFVDARRDKRGRRPAHVLQRPFEVNLFVLIRLAWLTCRKEVEAKIREDQEDWAAYQKGVQDLDLPEDPVRRPGRGDIRGKIEEATAKVLRDWGVLRDNRLPDRVTIYRNMKSAYLTTDAIDHVILGHWQKLVDPGYARQFVQFLDSPPPEAQ